MIIIVGSLATLSVSSFTAWLAAGWTQNRGLRAFALFLFCLVGMGLTFFIPGAEASPDLRWSKIFSYVFESLCIGLLPLLALGTMERPLKKKLWIPYGAFCFLFGTFKVVAVFFFLTPGLQTLIAVLDTLIAVFVFTFIVVNRRKIPHELTRQVVVRFTLVAVFFTPILFYNCIGIPGFTPFLNAYVTEGLFFFAVSAIIIAEARNWLASLARSPDSPGPTAPAGDHQDLSERQKEIAAMILAGDSAKEIASKLGISPKTAENHTYALYRKVGAKSRIQFYEKMRVPQKKP